MSYSNYPSTSSNPETEQPRDNRKLIYIILGALLIGTWGYIIYDKSKSKETFDQLQTQYTTVDSTRNAVQQEYNDALARMDSLMGNNTALKGELAERKNEIDQLKENIRTELSKKNSDLSKTRSMIAQLNGKITDLLAEIEQLKVENQQLTATNMQVTSERDTLAVQKQQVEENLSLTQAEKARIEDIGSTLHASNINISSINVKGSGKEKTTSTAKKVDVFRISFNLDENRITPSGSKEVYVVVTAPNGKPITIPESGSGTFMTRDYGEKVFTSKVNVNYEQGKRSLVSFDWKPESGKYQSGMYKIEIYQNGYKIGESTKELKKGGLFS